MRADGVHRFALAALSLPLCAACSVFAPVTRPEGGGPAELQQLMGRPLSEPASAPGARPREEPWTAAV